MWGSFGFGVVSRSVTDLDAQIEGLCDFEVGGEFALIPSFLNPLQGGGGYVAPSRHLSDAYALRLSLLGYALADLLLCHHRKSLAVLHSFQRHS